MPAPEPLLSVSTLPTPADDAATPTGGLDPARLAAANINPRTRLATDYLNHFNEAIMVLELLAEMPDCVDDMLAWRPLTYSEHFAASHFKDRELAVAAYDAADPVARAQLDSLADTMNAILVATRDALAAEAPGDALPAAAAAAARLKPLVAEAGAVINGVATSRRGGEASDAPQAAVDYLLEH